MSSEAGAASRVKVPVFETLGAGFRALAALGGVIWAQVALFVLAQLIASFVAGFVAGFIEAALRDSSAGDGTSAIPVIASQSFQGLVGFLLAVNLALIVSRWVLLRERPGVEAIFRWGRRQWRLLGVSLFCLVIVLIPMMALIFAIAYLGRPLLPVEALYPICALLLIPVFIWSMGWMCLTGPVVATDDPEGAFRRAWRLSRGNQLRLAILLLLLILSITIATGTLAGLLGVVSAIALPGNPLATTLVGEVMNLIASGVFQVWTAATIAVAFSILTGTNERPVGGFPPQPA
jgi:hypothetical protein